MLHSSLAFRIIFTQGLKFPKNIWANFLQIPITEVKICFKNTKNAFNKYRKRYPCFVYLRKICYNKGRFIYETEDIRTIFPSISVAIKLQKS